MREKFKQDRAYSIQQSGYTIVIVMILLALIGFVVRESLKRTQRTSQTFYEIKKRTDTFYDVENSFNKVLIHLRNNSHLYASLFSRANLYENSDLVRITSQIPSNDNAYLQIPVQIGNSSSESLMLVPNSVSELGVSNFPDSTDLTFIYTQIAPTAPNINVPDIFNGDDYGAAKVRLTLLDAIAEKSSGDPGSKASPSTTDFDPILRIDAMESLNSGTRVYGIVQGDIVNLFDYGIYGKTSLSLASTSLCDAYDSTGGTVYSVGIRTANCLAGSYSTSALTLTGSVYGKMNTNYASATTTNVCSNFTGGCPNAGKVCKGRQCAANLLDQYQNLFAEFCPTNQGNATANPALSPVTTVGKCWSTLGARTLGTVTLNSCMGCTPSGPYYTNILGFQANTSQAAFNPAAGGVVEVYFWNVTSNASYPFTIYDTNITNSVNRPYQVRLFYMGTQAITLAGTTRPLQAFIVAPFAQVTVNSNVVISGGVIANTLIVNSGAQIHYDSSVAGEGIIEDMQFRLRSFNQVHR